MMIESDQVKEAASKFPNEFGLKAYFGDVFRVGLSQSFMSDGVVMLYTQIKTENGWLDFVKGTVEELLDAVIEVGSKRTPRTTSWMLDQLIHTHNFKVDPEWLEACGRRDRESPIFEPLEVLRVSNFVPHLGVGFIQVKTPDQPVSGWCVDTRRGEWWPKVEVVK